MRLPAKGKGLLDLCSQLTGEAEACEHDDERERRPRKTGATGWLVARFFVNRTGAFRTLCAMSELRTELQAELGGISTESRLSLNIPLHVLLGEATDLAAFARRRWEPSGDGPGRPGRAGHPGLSSAARRFDAAVADDLLALVAAVQEEHTAFRLAAEPPVSRESVERGEALLDELTAALEFLFDDGVEDERDAQLEAIRDLYGTRSRSDDALAAALFDFATLASNHRDELEGLGGFDPANIDEARALAEDIRARPSGAERSEQARAHRVRRDQLATLLDRKVKQVRAAARYAFRRHPEFVRESASAYGRRSRAALRRRTELGADDTGEGDEGGEGGELPSPSEA